MTCTLFGHRDTTNDIEPILKSALIELIEEKTVDMFYIGKNGNFDRIAIALLESLKNQYPHINYFIVYAYVDEKEELPNAIYPICLKKSFSPIPQRNKWMIDHCDYVITYVRHNLGGAAKAKKYAIEHEKIIIEL